MQVRGYAEQKKAQCVGTHSKRRRSAWVRIAEEGAVRGYAARYKVQVRRHSKDVRRDRSRRCGATVEVCGVIEAAGAELQYMYAARQKVQVRRYAVQQKALFGYTQGSRR